MRDLNSIKVTRPIDEVIIHCTATAEGKDYTVADIDGWHKARGWSGIGYHYVVYRDGSVHEGRPVENIGAHVEGHNARTIGVTYIGGVAADGKTPKDTRTVQQKAALITLITQLHNRFKLKKLSGHNEYAAKACPSFDASKEYDYLVETAKNYKPVVDAVLSRGDSGKAVAEWRASLRKLGYDVPPGDVFDQLTEQATRWFQAKRNISIDGKAGAQTQDEAERAIKGLKPFEAIPGSGNVDPTAPSKIAIEPTTKDLTKAIALLESALTDLKS